MYSFFIVRYETQDDLEIPKAQDLDHLNKYFSRLLHQSSVLALRKQAMKTYIQKVYIACLCLKIDKFFLR